MRKLFLMVLLAGVAFASIEECNNATKQARGLESNASIDRAVVAAAYASAGSCFAYENSSRSCFDNYDKAAYIYANSSETGSPRASAYYNAAVCASNYSMSVCALDAERAGDIYNVSSKTSKLAAYSLAIKCARSGGLLDARVRVLVKAADFAYSLGDAATAVTNYREAVNASPLTKAKCSMISKYASLLQETGDAQGAFSAYSQAADCNAKFGNKTGCEQSALLAIEGAPDAEKPSYYERAAACFVPTNNLNESIAKCREYYTQAARLFESSNRNYNASVDHKRAGDCYSRTGTGSYYLCAQQAVKSTLTALHSSYNQTVTSLNTAINCYSKTGEEDNVHAKYLEAFLTEFKQGGNTSKFDLELLAADPHAEVRLPSQVEAATQNTFLFYLMVAAGVFIGLVAVTLLLKLFEREPTQEDEKRKLERLFRAREE